MIKDDAAFASKFGYDDEEMNALMNEAQEFLNALDEKQCLVHEIQGALHENPTLCECYQVSLKDLYLNIKNEKTHDLSALQEILNFFRGCGSCHQLVSLWINKFERSEENEF